jgi:hypothetical protein
MVRSGTRWYAVVRDKKADRVPGKALFLPHGNGVVRDGTRYFQHYVHKGQ